MRTQSKTPRIPERPDRVLSYFTMQKGLLLFLTVSGLIYNIGLAAGPWFEGQLAQCLLDIGRGDKRFSDMLLLACAYVSAIAVIQISRFFKRLIVRKFSNNINRCMKQVFYANLIRRPRAELEKDGVGSVMAKAVGDVDACSEGIRKFTTEIFDTGVALAVYVVMLLRGDWRLALLCLLFPPLSYLIAERMKVLVTRTSAESRACAGRLSAAALDRVSSALTYRVFGCEKQRDTSFEELLSEYEKKAVRAGIPAAAMQPLYQAISMGGVLFILYFGAKNVCGTGWTAWNIASLTTFFSCFTKLSVKSSHAAKLFNAVQKAQVSWVRIKEYLTPPEMIEEETAAALPAEIRAEGLGFSYPGHAPFAEGLSFKIEPGQIIGVTGPVACGKTALGRLFLGELPYTGSLTFDGKEFSSLGENLCGITGYVGHAPELISSTVENNVLLGSRGNAGKYLRAVCLDREIGEMPEGAGTLIGDGGVRLSGGQRQRLALARALAHPRPLYVLDDPFSALDADTEMQVYQNFRRESRQSTVLLLSHRLTLFPQTDGVIWMDGTHARFSCHGELMKTEPLYRELYEVQAPESKKKEAMRDEKEG